MLVHLVPAVEGMPKEEIQSRLSAGWLLVGRQAVCQNASIIDPTKPMGPLGVMDVDVWVLPEPMMPVGVVSQALFEVSKAHPGAKEVLGWVPVDFDGDPRPIGVTHDIGADEWGRFVYVPLVVRAYGS